MSCKIVSLTQKVWDVQEGSTPLKIPDDLFLTLLKNRGIEKINEFVNVSLSAWLPDPFEFVDMEKAIQRIIKSIVSGEKITILGDYDVDGVSSTALFINFFNHLGVDHSYHIPHRAEEGYGLNINNIRRYGDSLIIAVDCGSSSRDELHYARSQNIDVVVLDHHKMSFIPEAVAIVNPHRPDEKGQYKNLCACGLVFLCIWGIHKILSQNGFYDAKKIKEPDVMEYTDLVALATVCDVVDLVGLNRAFVSHGIQMIKRRKNLGIDAMISINKESEITSDTIAFFFGPRINAAGRIASADTSLKLLTTRNPIEAKKLALQLDELNRERQAIEAQIVEEASDLVDENLKFICSWNENWHVGVVGIVAGRLKEKYNKPCIIISIDKNGDGKASCRSIAGFDIADVINKGIAKGIITSGGGHALAAGFSISAKKINELMDFLKAEIKYEVTPHELYADCFLPLDSISMHLMKNISALGPFGMGNRHPKFVIPNLKITSVRIIGQNHIQTTLKDNKNNTIKAISFKSVNTKLGDILLNYRATVDVLGGLSVGEWKGEKYINLFLEDIAECA
ncbi:MAG: single-stranded-DNA-specific exonuclease RecJ [Holosporaceae bacterium]|jgi:single-stranded-DNA-specific exonuclease|nr:single-stranded-DNA-specific exonuclease RecJ [Holosporaceae bacterium]